MALLWLVIYIAIGFAVWLFFQFTTSAQRHHLLFTIIGLIIIFAAGGIIYGLITTGTIGAPSDGL